MKKFDINNFELYKNYVIEASAGTGKTYNIVEIVKKLVENEINLNEILIVTYTEKAAGELKYRIRNKVINQDVDNAPIYTIHSFCQSVIKEFGISSNLPLDLNLASDEDLKNFVDRFIREGEILEDISIFLKLGFDINIDTIKDKLIEGVNKYYLDLSFNEDGKIITLKKEENDYLNDLINKDNKYYKYFINRNSYEKIEDLFLLFPELEENFNVLSNSRNINEKGKNYCVELANELKNTFRENFNFSGNKFQKSSFKKIPQEFEAFDYFYNIKDLFKNVKTLITNYLTTKYLKTLYIAWQEEKEKNKKQTYNDMIRSVREKILDSNCSLKNKLQDKFKYAIIDEFQDTNQLQFDIFSNIFLTPNHNIIVVGDPKQSIYSFQGADVKVYSNAINEIAQYNGIKCSLSKNYRSTKNIVDSCNELFKHFNFEGLGEFNECESTTDREVKYEGIDTPSFWIAAEKLNDENEYAKAVVNEIINCCKKDENGKTNLQIKEPPKDGEKAEFRNVSFKDFAVLARTRSEMEPIVRIFKKVGIPFIKYKDANLFKGKECADFIALFEAIDSPDFVGSNRNIFNKALFTNFFGLSLKEIADENKDTSNEMTLINNWKIRASNNQWEDLIDDIIVSSGIIDRMSSLTKINSIGIYKQLGNYCVDYLINNHTISDLINNLNNLSKGLEEDEEGSNVEISTNFDAIQILTMHASKGLQFPIVVSIAGFKESKNVKCVNYHKENEKYLAFEKCLDYEKENLEEIKRLFYVGYTRAEFILMLPTVNKFLTKELKKNLKEQNPNFKDFILDSIKEYKDNKGKYKDISVSTKAYNELEKDVKDILGNSKNVDNDSKSNQEKELKTIIKESNSKKVYKHSYSSLSHPNSENEVDDKEGIKIAGLSDYDKNVIYKNSFLNGCIEQLDTPNDYPKGTNIGTCLHEVLEQTNFKDLNNLSYIIKNCFNKNNIKDKDEWTLYSKEIIENVINAKLPIIKGSNILDEAISLKDISNEDKKSEIEFSYKLGNDKLKNYCNGFIDLLFKQGEYYSIIDWKSDTLNEDFTSYVDIEELKSHVDDYYSIQRVIYSYTLIKWLKCYYKETEEEIFNNHFGGIYYVFLRGCNKDTGNGIYSQTWDSFKTLEESFNNIISKIGR